MQMAAPVVLFLSLLCMPVAAVAMPQKLPSCMSDGDCSFAGLCVAGACECDVGFMGATCSAFSNSTAVPMLSGFRMNDFHVWGSQVVYSSADQRYFMAASIYPAALPFLSQWLFTATIAGASALTPLGPYQFDSVLLPQGSPDAWDRNVMNPKLLRAPNAGSDTWLLFYTGNSYVGVTPHAGMPPPTNQSLAQASQCLGLATAPHPSGPFTRMHAAPVLVPRPGMWDARIISNAAIAPFGGNSTALLIVYKSSSPAGAGTAQTRVCLGVARADAYDAPIVRLRDDPILPCPDNSFYAEDPTLWRDVSGTFHLVFKDFVGHYTHEGYSGAHAVSTDGGVTWALTTPPLAYTTTHLWTDGALRTQHSQERVQILLNATDGSPMAVFYATDTELDGLRNKTWNMAVPLRGGL